MNTPKLLEAARMEVAAAGEAAPRSAAAGPPPEAAPTSPALAPSSSPATVLVPKAPPEVSDGVLDGRGDPLLEGPGVTVVPKTSVLPAPVPPVPPTDVRPATADPSESQDGGAHSRLQGGLGGAAAAAPPQQIPLNSEETTPPVGGTAAEASRLGQPSTASSSPLGKECEWIENRVRILAAAVDWELSSGILQSAAATTSRNTAVSRNGGLGGAVLGAGVAGPATGVDSSGGMKMTHLPHHHQHQHQHQHRYAAGGNSHHHHHHHQRGGAIPSTPVAAAISSVQGPRNVEGTGGPIARVNGVNNGGAQTHPQQGHHVPPPTAIGASSSRIAPGTLLAGRLRYGCKGFVLRFYHPLQTLMTRSVLILRL